MSRLAFPAMGTRVEVVVPSQDVGEAHRVRDLFATWEAALSRFLPASELSVLNARGGGVASPLLTEVLGTALLAAHTTGGLFDPGMAAQLEAAGYDRPFEDMDPSAPAPQAAPRPGGAWRRVVLTDRRMVRLPEGMRLDLGGIAKGMAVDASVAVLRRAGVPGGIVSAGGDLVAWGLPPCGRAWTVAVEGHAGNVPLRWGALATSSVARRRWGTQEREAHHTLDPRTGLPAATDLVSASVVASRCRDAEVAATAALILGARDGASFLAERGLHGLLIPRDAEPVPVGAWPPSRSRREATL